MLNIKHEQSKLLSKLKEQKSNQDSFLLGTNFNFFKTNYTFPNDSLLSWAYFKWSNSFSQDEK